MMMSEKNSIVSAARNNVLTRRLKFLLARKYANSFQEDKMELVAVMMFSISPKFPTPVLLNYFK